MERMEKTDNEGELSGFVAVPEQQINDCGAVSMNF